MTITPDEVAFYRQAGYLVVDEVLDAATLAAIKADLDRVVADATHVTSNDDVYDLEPGHTPQSPRVRRIKAPHKVMPSVNALIRHPAMVGILTRLLGDGVRFQTSKLNMKSAGFGAAVEWHQDWAFYPHTNDDLLAVGIMLDEIDESNGPMLVVPGSHTGPVYDHHANGSFCGAMDPTRCDVDFDSAVPIVGKAGSMSFHHVRAVHGSAVNRSGRSRNFLLFQFTAADAWPLMGGVADLAAYDKWLVAGDSTNTPRLTAVPVRLPLPAAPMQGSIYENQRALANRYFDDVDTGAATAVDATQ
ncbi:MAG: phytanoyl-CoA dioxygenase family protein [Burkholderiaceae bacterium]